jgi:hypothetical protein
VALTAFPCQPVKFKISTHYASPRRRASDAVAQGLGGLLINRTSAVVPRTPCPWCGEGAGGGEGHTTLTAELLLLNRVLVIPHAQRPKPRARDSKPASAGYPIIFLLLISPTVSPWGGPGASRLSLPSSQPSGRGFLLLAHSMGTGHRAQSACPPAPPYTWGPVAPSPRSPIAGDTAQRTARRVTSPSCRARRAPPADRILLWR